MKSSNILTISGINIEVEYKKIRNIHLAVYPPDARVHISAPDYCTEEDLRAFALSKTAWIKSQRESLLEAERQTRREYVSGENHYLFGMRYILRVIEQGAVPHVEKTHTHLLLYVRPGATREKRMEVLRDFYRAQLHDCLTFRFQQWQSRMDTHDFTWSIQMMKTQWGSCTQTTRTIRMNLLLARVPIECIDYVVVHEMCHLQERLHNKVFEALMTKYMPTWRKSRTQLNEFVGLSLSDFT